MEVKDGRGCVSIQRARVLAFRSPRRPRSRLLDTMRARLHRALKAKPLDESLLSEANANMEKLRPKALEASSFIEAAKQRLDRGELDDTTFYSESLPAKTVLMLQRVLEETMAIAVERGDAGAVSFVNMAAQVLLRRIDGGSLLRKVSYPSNGMQGVFLSERVAVAQELFGAVVDALDGAHIWHDVDAIFPPQG